MSRPLTQILNVFKLLPKTLLVVLAVSAPMLAVPVARGSSGETIEAPANKKTGAGFVLMVSLQRA